MIWERIGVELKRGTMSNWVLKCGAMLSPIVELFKQKIVAEDYARADETTAQVLKEPGRKVQTKSYMWVYMIGIGWTLRGANLTVSWQPLQPYL